MSTALSPNFNNLFLKSFAKSLEINLPINEQFGKLSKNQIETKIRTGDEIDFLMPPEGTLNAHSVANITYQKVKTNTIKIVCDQAFDYGFSFEDSEIAHINALPEEKAVPFITDLTKNVTEKFITKRELTMANLSSFAGFKLNESPIYNPSSDGNYGASASYVAPLNPLALTQSNIKIYFQNMASLLQDGQIIDGVPRSSWKEGKMLMFVPPSLKGLLVGTGDFKYTAIGVENAIKGEIGEYAGFRIIQTNMIQPTTTGGNIFNILAGIEGEVFGTIMTKNLTSETLRDVNTIATLYRGLGIFGVKYVRRDKAATSLVSVSYKS